MTPNYISNLLFGLAGIAYVTFAQAQAPPSSGNQIPGCKEKAETIVNVYYGLYKNLLPEEQNEKKHQTALNPATGVDPKDYAECVIREVESYSREKLGVPLTLHPYASQTHFHFYVRPKLPTTVRRIDIDEILVKSPGSK